MVPSALTPKLAAPPRSSHTIAKNRTANDERVHMNHVNRESLQLDLETNYNRRFTDPGKPGHRPALSEPLLTVEQTAQLLGLSKDTIYRYAESRRIPCFKIGQSLRFKLSVLEKWLAGLMKGSLNDACQLAPVAPRIKSSQKTTKGGCK
jgi:excisionase family DNA binding protein